MIEFPNGLSISEMVISTAFGHSGSGLLRYFFSWKYRKLLALVKKKKLTIIAESSTRDPNVGNFISYKPLTWKYVQRLSSLSMLNAHGLTNPGVERCAAEIATSRRKGFNVVPSFYPEFSKGMHHAIADTIFTIKLFCDYFESDKWILELNCSCPNAKEDISKNIKMATRCVERIKEEYPEVVLIAKTSIMHPYDFYMMLEDTGADCIHAINTIPWVMISDDPSPLAHVGGGGVSGEVAFKRAQEYNMLVPHYTSLPIIFGCGVVKPWMVKQYADLYSGRSASGAVSICTWAIRDPRSLINFIEKKERGGK